MSEYVGRSTLINKKLSINNFPIGTYVEQYIEECRKGSSKPVQPRILGLGSKYHGNEFHVIVDHMCWPYGADMTVEIYRLFKIHFVASLQYDTDLYGVDVLLESDVY